jgi:hypothetical protein
MVTTLSWLVIGVKDGLQYTQMNMLPIYDHILQASEYMVDTYVYILLHTNGIIDTIDTKKTTGMVGDDTKYSL